MRDQTSLDDRALVEAALRDRNAFSWLVRRYEPLLTRYVRRLLGSRSQGVEDVLQEIFIKAYVNLNDYDRTRPFGPWIYRIAHNEAVSQLRRRSAERLFIGGEDALLIFERISDGSDLGAAIGFIRDEQLVRAVLANLDAKYRDVLVLRYLEEKSYDEIADILRLPPGTVATYIRRGLRRLRATLEEADTGMARAT